MTTVGKDGGSNAGASASRPGAIASGDGAASVSAHSGDAPSRGVLHAYGHAAYCAGWKAALLCVRSPAALSENHSRDWIEGHPPESFITPIVWAMDSDTDRSGKADETAQQAQPEARAGAEGIAQKVQP